MNKILIEIGHPNDVHQFYALYRILIIYGIDVMFAVKSKDITVDLVSRLNVAYEIIGMTPKRISGKLLSILIITTKLYQIAKQFEPDILISRVSPHSGIVSRILRKTHIGFTDTENVGMLDTISVPLTDYILTSDSYNKDFGSKHIRYKGYIETWYLHPKRFTPDPSVLQRLKLGEGERYAILRFVSWEAHHDRGLQGVSYENKLMLVAELSKQLRVFISSEKPLPLELQKYQYNIDPSDMHNALYYAHLYFGESATMASECAMLGTPAVYVDDGKRGYIDDQVNRKLVMKYSATDIGQADAINHAIDLARDPNAKIKLIPNHDDLIAYVDDVTEVVSQFILSKLNFKREK